VCIRAATLLTAALQLHWLGTCASTLTTCLLLLLHRPPRLLQAEVREQHPAVMQLLGEYQAAKAAAVQQQQGQPRELQGIGRTTCAVTPLGTCSACPSNHRNVSAYYMDLFQRGGLLMDCGECAWGHKRTPL
jgi:hypothetical protein